MRPFLSLCLALTACAASAAEPVPCGHAGESEVSAAFRIRFDRLPCASPVLGAFTCTADAEGRIAVTYRAEPSELLGDFTVRSSLRVKPGEWHDVATSFSIQRTRAVLYVDGLFQYESDTAFLPRLVGGEVVWAERPEGCEVRDAKVYDFELGSEELTSAGDGSGLTIAAAKRRATVARNLAALDAAVEGASAGRYSDELAVYTVRPFTQEVLLPHTLPRDGDAKGPLRVFAAPDQLEAGSLLAFARKGPVTVTVGTEDLRRADGRVFPKANIEVKLVKRWFRSGGAWMTYHWDGRQRNLTPDLLLNDDGAVRVDEFRRRNYLRLNYPEGTVWADVSDRPRGHEAWKWTVPFDDAKGLRPVTIPEAGRNQQFLVSFKVAADCAPGRYEGAIALNGVRVPTVLDVLPIDLPAQGSPKDGEGSYISRHNYLEPMREGTLERKRELLEMEMRISREHAVNHLSGAWESPEYAALARKVGLVPDCAFQLLQGKEIPNWKSFFPDVPEDELGEREKAAGLRAVRRVCDPHVDEIRRIVPELGENYVIFYSETRRYPAICRDQEERAAVAHALGFKVDTHAMADEQGFFDGDLVDMAIHTSNTRQLARERHGAGAGVMNYADPFPSSENPGHFRRRLGAFLYLLGYDGHMMHGVTSLRTPYNEFADDATGDGQYRNFAMWMPAHFSVIRKLAYEGMGAGYNDVRYFTALKRQAEKYRDCEDEALRREARRQLVWLETRDGLRDDVDALRLAAADRILTLGRLARERGASK